MRIIATENTYEIEKEKANEGCFPCPICGETRSIYDWMKVGGKRFGISKNHTTRIKGYFGDKLYDVDIYECDSCGVKWESEPYNFRRGR